MADTVRPDVAQFFDRYDRAGKAGDAVTLRDCFCDPFLALDPARAAAVTPDALIGSLPARRQLFDSVGAEGLDLAGIKEEPLDGLHTLVATTWTARFREGQEGEGPLELGAHFLLRQDDGAWRIAVYLNHSDLGALFQARAAATR